MRGSLGSSDDLEVRRTVTSVAAPSHDQSLNLSVGRWPCSHVVRDTFQAALLVQDRMSAIADLET